MLLVFQNDRARQIAKDILKDIRVHTSIYFGTAISVLVGVALVPL
jgi:hypothetical protein